MDWKKKLMMATGAFASMPAAVIAHETPNLLRARRVGVLERRATSVPFIAEPSNRIRVNVRVPRNNARRAFHYSPDNQLRKANLGRCNSYRVRASYFKIEAEGARNLLRTQSADIKVNGGTGFEFDLSENIDGSANVVAKVEVTPNDTEDCISTEPLTSFSLKGEGGDSQFLPARDLSPVLIKMYVGPPIIIKK